MDEKSGNASDKGAETSEQGKKGQPPKKSLVDAAKSFYNDIMGEFKKVIWLGRKELTKKTITVIITSAVIGGVIVGFDYIFAFCYNLLMGLIS